MRSVTLAESPEMLPGVGLEKGEELVFSGYAMKWIVNPVEPGGKAREGFVLTSRRLIMLARPRWGPLAGRDVSKLTSMPLRRIDGIQAIHVRWGLLNILLFLLPLLLYVIPGLIFLVWMSSRAGLWLSVSSGGCSHEIKFARGAAPMLSELMTLVNTHAGLRS